MRAKANTSNQSYPTCSSLHWLM